MDPTLKVAKKYPDVHFEHATGFKRDRTWRPIPRAGSGPLYSGTDRGEMSKKG